MQFIDLATITVHAGHGGKGMVSFRREKYVPKGGPDGGTGGKGGNVIVRATRHLNTLLDFRYNRQYKAGNGIPGQSANKTGKNGNDIVLEVPCGTIVRNIVTDEIIADLLQHGSSAIVVHGGRGGKGNAEFATPTNQTPRIAQPGEPGEEITIQLELKLLADVGLIGFPNAGKSTLIASISAAKPKIADYPFTTLVPNLGIVRYKEFKSFTVADIPGLIEGAHQGKGLGMQFLRHIERTKVLVFLIECFSKKPKNDFEILMNELESYNPSLLNKPRLVALTKIDTLDDYARKKLDKLKFEKKIPVCQISAVSHEGIDSLVETLWQFIEIANR
ncbi:MAG: GTPase ObgE [Bacteroidota bacterium]